MTNAPDFLTLDLAKDEQELVSALEAKLSKTLYPAQVERIMMNVFAQYLYNAKVKFNEAAKLNLARFSKAPFLDFIGEPLDCERLQPENGYSILRIELYEAFTSDLTIDAGLEILTKDEKYSFITVEDLIIPAGETIGLVKIESVVACVDVNNYGIGDINILVKPFSYIKSVRNIIEVTGGSDEESDESYFERMCLAPESFSCAGAKNSYIYQTLSAHSAIIDATVESPQIPASIITVEDETEIECIEENGIITGNDYTCSVNYHNGEMLLSATINGETKTFKITLPPAATVNVYPLTKYETLPESVKQAVEEKLSGKDVTPMTDYVNVYSPERIEKELNLTVIIDDEGDTEQVKQEVEKKLNEYKAFMRSKLNQKLDPNYIISIVYHVEGVYSCRLDNMTEQNAAINQFFDLTINTVYERRAI